jgi:hypothetical protein
MTNFSPGKLALFAFANIAGGLLQVWVLYLALASLGRPHTVAVLLGDGGLFFFSTSLTVNSILVLLSESKSKPSSIDITLTGVAIFGSLVASIVVYIAVLVSTDVSPAPFHDHVLPQVMCAAVALAYAVYAGVRTGYFGR